MATKPPIPPDTSNTAAANSRRLATGSVAWPRSLVLPLGLFALGAAAGWWIGHAPVAGAFAGAAPGRAEASGAVALPASVTAVRSGSAGLAHELVACEEADRNGHLEPVAAAIQAAIEQAQGGQQASHISVAIVDLEAGGRWMTDADREYFPASMLKLPLAIAWMHYAERHPDALSKEIRFNYPQSDRESGGAQALVTGQTYTVRELLHRMLTWSRNDAKALLQQNLPEAELRATYAELNLPWPYRGETADAVITMRHMVRIFESLYNASWLERESAEYLLDLMVASDFRDAIVAGLPPGTRVAHKWGHRDVPGGEGLEAAHTHDCGIIYKPGRPYLFCAMTMGNKGWQLTKVIGQLSSASWNAMP